MGLDKFAIGIVLFMVMVMGSLMLIGDLNTNYEGVNIDASDLKQYNDTFNQSEFTALTNTMNGFIIGGEVDDDQIENSMFKGAFSALRLITLPFRVTGQVIMLTVQLLGIPAFFQIAAIIILGLFVMFGMIYAVLRLRA